MTDTTTEHSESPQAVGPRLDRPVRPRPGTRTWGDGERCAECCNGDRCDDASHYDRTSTPGCPHCWNTGWALWTAAGQRSYAKYRGWDAYREDIVAAERAKRVANAADDCVRAVLEDLS